MITHDKHNIAHHLLPSKHLTQVHSHWRADRLSAHCILPLEDLDWETEGSVNLTPSPKTLTLSELCNPFALWQNPSILGRTNAGSDTLWTLLSSQPGRKILALLLRIRIGRIYSSATFSPHLRINLGQDRFLLTVPFSRKVSSELNFLGAQVTI